MKYIAQQMIRLIKKDNADILVGFKVNKGDRDHQVWKPEPLGVELFTPGVCCAVCRRQDGGVHGL